MVSSQPARERTSEISGEEKRPVPFGAGLFSYTVNLVLIPGRAHLEEIEGLSRLLPGYRVCGDAATPRGCRGGKEFCNIPPGFLPQRATVYPKASPLKIRHSSLFFYPRKKGQKNGRSF